MNEEIIEQKHIDAATSDKVKDKIDNMIKKEEKKAYWKKAHKTEDLVKHGELQLEGDLTPDQEKFHKFGIGMLNFELGGQVTGQKGFIVLMMRKTAKTLAYNLKFNQTRQIIRSVNDYYKDYDKHDLEGFYFLTVKRYLKIVSFR